MPNARRVVWSAMRLASVPRSSRISSEIIAFILCFVDIIKELPITLILRPFNFDTLAVKTYEYAIEEMIMKSSIYSLIIILLGAVLLIFLRKIINKSVDVS